MGIIVLLTLVSAGVGAALGAFLNRVAKGALLGLLLGPIGWVILFLLPRETSHPKDP
ncbi:hypothetical protein N9X77_01055 [Luminiphilus sp.]|nr:hypothetical protein [Luminiphilus sp.]